MKIECKLKRKDGTHVTLGTTKYHFAPLPDDAHVAVVENTAHQDIFLGIPEGYGIYRGKDEVPTPVAAPVAPVIAAVAPVVTPVTDDQPEALYGSNVHPSSFDIHGKTYSLGDVVALANTASGLDVKEWNELSDDTRADLIDEELEKLNAAGPVVDPADTNADGVVDDKELRAQLASMYEAKTGKKPHGKWTAEKIREQLNAG